MRIDQSLGGTTIAILAESITQLAVTALTSTVVPEFKGAPGEDVREFLGVVSKEDDRRSSIFGTIPPN